LNCRRSGKTCSRTRVLVATTLLMILGAIALALGSGGAKVQVADIANFHGLSASDPTAFVHAPSAHAPTVPSTRQVLATYSQLPMTFEPNQGQTDASVRFLARGGGYSLYLTADEAILALQHSGSDTRTGTVRTSAVSMKLVGAISAEPAGDVLLPGKSNYLIGNDPAKWHRGIPQFARVRYRNVYPGVDLVYYGNQGRLEYDFEVAPGSDPRQVAFKFQSLQNPELQNLKVTADGDVVLNAGVGDVRLRKPRVYQKFGTDERNIAGRFELRGQKKDEVGFEVGAYDPSRALIIDPVLAYSTYLGGSGNEACSVIAPINIDGIPAPPAGCPAVAVDPAFNVYVAGATTSTDFPATSGKYQPGLATGATANAFIAKFTPAGSLLFATYLGGDGVTYTAGIGVDTGLDIIVAGTTTSGNFPTKGTNAAFQATPVNGGTHVFVSKLDPTATILLYSTYLSGTGVDIASGLALDPGGNAYVTGTTTSTEVGTGFPSTLGSYQPLSAATNQFFLTKVDPNAGGAASLLYSTYFGGSSPANGVTLGGGVAVDINSDAYITGGTNFTNMPLLNAYQAINEGQIDAFVAKINPGANVAQGQQLLYSTYLGGSGDDIGYGIAVDSGFDAYITGSTTSTDFNIGDLTTTALQPGNGGGTDAFVAKLGVLCVGTSCTVPLPLTYFSYLGGAGTDVGTAIGVDNNSAARITGWTNSPNFPIVGNYLQLNFGGGTSDAFFASVDTLATCSPITTPTCVPTSTSSYFGGTGADFGSGLALDLQGSSYITGETASSSGFPLKNSAQGALDGPNDAYVTKLAPLLNLTMPSPTATPLVVGMGSQVSFAYTITNSGEFTNNVTFTDNLPVSGATFVSATASPGTCGSAVGQTVLCSIGSLNAAATATVTVVLTPVAPTIPGGTVNLGNSGSAGVGGSTLATASASVTVNDFKITVSPATATVPAGVPAIYNATITPSSNSGFPDSISISCGSGLPTGASCLPGNNNPIPNLNTGAQSCEVIINSTARVTTTTELRHGNGSGMPLYATLLPVSGLALLGVGMGGKRSRRLLMGLLMGVVFASLMYLPACSSGSTTTVTTGTPAGTYTVTVNAVSGTATRSTLVALVVQ
jgi:Domain of unknown function DUF11/Beta-propeller repeat